MIEQFCRNIYNIGLQLKCGLPSINCRCPDKDTYEYLCYQCYLELRDIIKEDYKLQFNGKSGEVIILHDFKQENRCTSEEWSGYYIINVIVKNVANEIREGKQWSEKARESVIELVALSLTQAAIRDIGMISYINIINAFKIEQLIDYFWNLSVNIMQRMQLDEDFGGLLDKMCQCIDDINVIYENYERIGNQYKHYLDLICIGLEKMGGNLLLERAFLYQQEKAINKKLSADNLKEFLFWDMDTDEKLIESELKDVFVRICSIMKQYISSYQEQNDIESALYERLISLLGFFAEENLKVNSIDGLEELDLHTTQAWKANARIVRRYLQKIRKENMIVAYEPATSA